MIYFDSATDALLVDAIQALLAKGYYRQMSVRDMTVEPLTVYSLKADKLSIPGCTSEDIDGDTAGAFIHGGCVITNAACSGTYTVKERLDPDDDLVTKIIRLVYYSSNGDATNTYSMIKDISQESKNILLENLSSIRKHPLRDTVITPCSL